MGEVIAIHIKSEKRAPMIPLQTARLVEGLGIEGNRGVRPGSHRQVLVMPAEVLDAFGLKPGDVRENLTTRGLDVMALRPGDRLCIGKVVLEATGDCTPCEMLDSLQPGLKDALEGQRGMLFQVLAGGEIGVGNPIEVAPREE